MLWDWGMCKTFDNTTVQFTFNLLWKVWLIHEDSKSYWLKKA